MPSNSSDLSLTNLNGPKNKWLRISSSPTTVGVRGEPTPTFVKEYHGTGWSTCPVMLGKLLGSPATATALDHGDNQGDRVRPRRVVDIGSRIHASDVHVWNNKGDLVLPRG